jgi:hypothetical protein
MVGLEGGLLGGLLLLCTAQSTLPGPGRHERGEGGDLSPYLIHN